MSLVGIVVSTVLGAVFQLKESSDNAARALELAQAAKTTLESTKQTAEGTRQTAESTKQTAESTERTARNTDQTLTQVHRLLVPLDEVMISLGFGLPCSETAVQSLCETVFGYGDDEEHGKFGRVPWSDSALAATLNVKVFRDRNSAEDYLSRKQRKDQTTNAQNGRKPNLSFRFNIASGGEHSNLVLRNKFDPDTGQQGEAGAPQVALINYPLSRNNFRINDGTALSINDLIGATAVIQLASDEWGEDKWDDDKGAFSLEDFSMSFRNNMKLVAVGIRHIPLEEGTLYVFTLRR